MQFRVTMYSVFPLGTASKPNRQLTDGSIRFQAVSVVQNNDNQPWVCFHEIFSSLLSCSQVMNYHHMQQQISHARIWQTFYAAG